MIKQRNDMALNNHSIRDHLSYILAEAHRALHRKLERQLRHHNVQVEHWRVLEILSDEQALPMGELAELVLMNHPALTKMIDRMVEEGWVTRGADARDNRRVIIEITNAGLKMYQKLHARAVRVNDDLMASLGRDGTEDLRDLLADVMRSLDT